MSKKPYREKSQKKETMEESIDSYVKAFRPSIVILIVAFVVIAAGFFIWLFVGEIEVFVHGASFVENEKAAFFIKKDESSKVKVGQSLYINKIEGKIEYIYVDPVQVSKEKFGEYFMQVGKFSEGDWLIATTATIKVSNGTYGSDVVVDTILPISYIFNQ